MNLIIHEFLKIFLNKRIRLILVGLIILNGTLIYIQESSQNTELEPAAYRNIYHDLSEMSNKEAAAKLEKELTELKVLMEISFTDVIDENWEASINERYQIDNLTALLEKEQQGDYLNYSTGIWNEMFLYEHVLNEVDQTTDYDRYLQEMAEDAERLTSVSLFSKPGTFSYRNIVKTPQDFEHLRGNELVAAPSKGIVMATQFGITDILAILFLMVIVMQLVTREKEQESLAIIKTTYKGRGTLIMAKLSVVMISSMILVVSLYTVNYLLAAATYGFGPMDRLVQSVQGFISSSFDITVFEYLALFLIAKLLVFALIALLFFMIAVIMQSSMTVYLTIAAILGISGMIYIWIPVASLFSFFKYINLIHFLNTDKLFSQYLNLNLFGYPFQYVYSFIIMIILSFIVFTFVSYRVFCQSKHLETHSSVTAVVDRMQIPNLGKHVSIFRHEAHKILIINKVLLILLAGVALQYYTYQPLTENLNTFDEYYYKNYMLELEGPLTSEKEIFLVSEQERFADLNDEYARLSMDENVSDLQLAQLGDKLASENAFNKVLEHADYLRSIKSGKDVDGWFLYDQGYQMLTASEDNGPDTLQALLLMILLIACLTPLFTYEMQTEMIRVISPTQHGRGKVFYSKMFLGVLISSFIYMLIYTPEFFNILSTYGTRAIDAPAISMSHLNELPFQMSILQYLVFISIVRYVGILLAGLVIYYISVRSKSLITVALNATAILALPILFSIINITLFDYLFITPLLTANVLFKEYSLLFLQNYRGYWLIFLTLVVVISYWIFFKLLRKKYIR